MKRHALIFIQSNLYHRFIYAIFNKPEMFAGFIILLPQIDIRDFSIDGADVGPPF